MARKTAQLLIVEDCKWQARKLASQVSTALRWNAEVVVVQSQVEAEELLRQPVRWIGAIVDFRLPDGDGLQVLAAFRKVEPKAPAMLLTAYPIDAGLSSAAGQHLAVAVGKDWLEGMLCGFVRYCERLYLQGTEAVRLVRRFIRAGGLSQREADVLRRMMIGESKREAAVAMGLKVRTVETYMNRALAKLGAKGVVELAHMLLKLALGDDWFPSLKESA